MVNEEKFESREPTELLAIYGTHFDIDQLSAQFNKVTQFNKFR